MARFTRGPWVFHKRGQRIYGGSFQGAKIAQMAITPEWEANAALIAAAPDLVEALQEIADGLPSVRAPHRFSEARKIARTAISKALGEQS